ncbi:MAG TPA: hypothetical protein VF606_03030, partial [Geminicoccaceae bacterium]
RTQAPGRAEPSRRRLRRGVFGPPAGPRATINRLPAETAADPRPFAWTADPDRVTEEVRRGNQA